MGVDGASHLASGVSHPLHNLGGEKWWMRESQGPSPFLGLQGHDERSQGFWGPS